MVKTPDICLPCGRSCRYNLLTMARLTRSGKAKPTATTVELVVLTSGRDTTRCRRLADRKPVTLTARGGALLVPGHVATVRVRSERQLATRLRIDGDVIGVRTGLDAFDLPPWQPTPFEMWDQPRRNGWRRSIRPSASNSWPGARA